MSFYLSTQELPSSYRDAKQFAKPYFYHFDEYERIARNEVNPKLRKNYPKITDGTTSALILENAKRVFPAMFKGKFKCTDRNDAWLDELATIIWNNRIVPGAKADADFYTKFWNMYYRAQQHGAAVAFVFFTVRDGYKGVDFTLDYIRDVYPEPGKLSYESSNYIWRNHYMTKLDLQKLIDKVKREKRKAKQDGRDSFGTWDLGALQEFLNRGPDGKDVEDKNRDEAKKQQTPQLYKFATCYHKGYNAPFYTIIPSLDGRLCRTRYNENPTGEVPIVPMYYTQDLVNPFGKGLIEVARAGQNTADFYQSADVLATQIGLEPPVKVKGDPTTKKIVLKSIQYGPRAMWRVGDGDVETQELANGVYSQLPQRLSTIKSNLMNQLGNFDNTVGSNAGNPQFSKTDAGVDTLNARANVNDNFFTNSGMSAAVKLATEMMNIYFANMEGKDILDVNEDEVERLRNAGFDMGDARQIELEFKDYRGKFLFEVEDKQKWNDPETQAMAEGIKTLTETEGAIESIEADGYHVDLGEAWRQYFGRLLPNADRIIVPINSDKEVGSDAIDQQGQQQPTAAPQMAATADTSQQPAAQSAVKAPSGSINYKDAPPDVQAQMEAADGYTPSVTHAADLHARMNPQPPVPTPQTQPVTPQSQQQQPAQPMLQEDPAKLREELQNTMTAYKVDQNAAAQIMAVRRAGISEDKIAAYMLKLEQQGGTQ